MDVWPSTRVAQGGIFHPRKVTYSKETHDLLKILMEEQKMTIFQRNKVEYYLRTGTPLPSALYPPQKPAVARSRSSSCQARGRIEQRRTLESIQASGALEHERYVPPKPLREPSEKQKIQLQERMSGLKHYTDSDVAKIKKRLTNSNYKERQATDPIDQLLKEISDRAEWLEEMEELGEGKQHRPIIMAEIAERVRLLKELEKKRELDSCRSTTSSKSKEHANN